MTPEQAKEHAEYMASKDKSVEAAAIAFGCMLALILLAAIWPNP